MPSRIIQLMFLWHELPRSLQASSFFFFFLSFCLLYNIVLVFPYINMHPPRVYTCFLLEPRCEFSHLLPPTSSPFTLANQKICPLHSPLLHPSLFADLLDLLSGLPLRLSSKESACQAEDASSITGSGRSHGGGNGNQLQHSCQENFMDKEPGGLQSVRSQKVKHGWTHCFSWIEAIISVLLN